MLRITVPAQELWDEKREIFLSSEEVVLELEHSLVSLSKWEEIFEKPFLGHDKKTSEETQVYISCMSLGEPISPELMSRFSTENIEKINDYINSKMTATWFADSTNGRINREVITAEIIYYWMAELGLDISWENRHLSKLLTQLRVINLKRQPKKNVNRAEAAAQQRSLNAQRRAEMNSRG